MDSTNNNSLASKGHSTPLSAIGIAVMGIIQLLFGLGLIGLGVFLLLTESDPANSNQVASNEVLAYAAYLEAFSVWISWFLIFNGILSVIASSFSFGFSSIVKSNAKIAWLLEFKKSIN